MNRLLVEKEESVWVVKFHNPPHGYMDHITASEFAALLDDAEASGTLRAVILTGSEPGVFIRHYDVGELLQTGELMAAKGIKFSADRPVPESDVHCCLRRMEEMSIPFIAAINGIAMGGGMEMALACDLRLVQDGPYDLGLPEVNVGLLPGAGGTQRMTRLLGQGKAMELIMLGKTVSPAEAAACGLVMECVHGDVLQRAREVAIKVAESSPLAIQHIKTLVRGAADWSSEEGLATERTLFCDLMVAPGSLAAMADMVEKGGDIRDR